MTELHTPDEAITEKLVKELNSIEQELEKYKLSLNGNSNNHSTDMLLKPLKQETQVVETPATPAHPINNERLKAIEREIVDMQGKLGKLEEMNRKLDMLDEMDENVSAMKRLIDERLRVDFQAMYQNILDQMNIEAIKVYRNVQAVIVEEDAKQNHVLLGVDGKASKLKRRMNHVMIVSIVSFVVSIIVMIMQILPALGINLW